MLFQLAPGGFSDLMHWNNYNSDWKKQVGFRNLQQNQKKKSKYQFQYLTCSQKRSICCLVEQCKQYSVVHSSTGFEERKYVFCHSSIPTAASQGQYLPQILRTTIRNKKKNHIKIKKESCHFSKSFSKLKSTNLLTKGPFVNYLSIQGYLTTDF